MTTLHHTTPHHPHTSHTTTPQVKVTKTPKADIARLIDQMHDNDLPVSHEGGRQLQQPVVEAEAAPAKEETAEAED